LALRLHMYQVRTRIITTLAFDAGRMIVNNKSHKYRRSTRGFTLIELLLVVVIMGTLAAMAIPRFMMASTRSKQSEAKQILKQIYISQRSYFQENGAYSANLANLGITLQANCRYAYTIIVNGAAFTATANAPDPGVDDDPAPDIWQINDAGILSCLSNDVIL